MINDKNNLDLLRFVVFKINFFSDNFIFKELI